MGLIPAVRIRVSAIAKPQPMQSRRTTVLVPAIAAFLAATAVADTISLTPIDDNTIIEDASGAYSAGMAQYFFAGRVGTNGGGTLRRGAIRFNLAVIPPGSTISSVTLKMYCSASGASGTQTIGLKRFTASWGEGTSVAFGGGGAIASAGDVTWLYRFFPGSAWTTPGGQFSSTVTTSASVGGQGYYNWPSTAQFVSDVQAMVNIPSQNFGWCVQGNEATLQSVRRFDSQESTNVAARPQLTITYTPAPSRDLTGDYKVDGADLAVLLAGWNGSGPADFNGDGSVGGSDLAILLAAWTQ